jgi:hypothetical protein
MRQFLGKQKRETMKKLALPGSTNLAAKSGNVTRETMKILQISAGAMQQLQASSCDMWCCD